MAILSLACGATVGEITKQMDVSSQFVTPEINKLVAVSIVEKLPNERDARSVLLTLGRRGMDLIEELLPIRLKSNDVMYRSVTCEAPERGQMAEARSSGRRQGAAARHGPDRLGPDTKLDGPRPQQGQG